METKKLAKRRHGGDTVESSAERAKPIYLLAALRANQPTPSVLMVDAAAAAGGDRLRRVRTIAQLPGASDAMSFVAAHSEHGSWIVGVGGLLDGDTIIYNPSTKDLLRGPDLSYPKHKPILISHLGKVYALSCRPRVHYKSKYDYLPWFESLDLEEEDDYSFWMPLSPPPCFPCFLEPLEYRNPPDVSVSSYAAVGSHILISLQQQETGTYAFHVVEGEWEKVCDKNLPFVGQAVPLGGSLFTACCVIPDANNAAASVSVLHMSMEVSSTPTVPGKLTTTIIQEFEKFLMVSSEVQVPSPILCPLGEQSFCSIRVRSRSRSSCQKRNRSYSKDLQIILSTFQIDNNEALWTKSTDVKELDIPLQVKQQIQTYNIKGGSPFPASHMPVITALSM